MTASPSSTSCQCRGVQPSRSIDHLVMGLAICVLFLALYLTMGSQTAFPDRAVTTADIGLFFSIGLISSLHCVGMCGGMVLLYQTQSTHRGLLSHCYYATGKTLSYTLLGAGFGLLGGLVQLTVTMRGLFGVVLGIGVVTVALGFTGLLPGKAKIRRWNTSISSLYGRATHPFCVGMLNGAQILCGPLQAVYLLAAGSGSPLVGASILFAFGLATLPIMLCFAIFSHSIQLKYPRILQTVTTCIILGFGLLMINRGLALLGPGYDFTSLVARVNQEKPPPMATTQTKNAVVRIGAQGWSQDQLVFVRDRPITLVIWADKVTHCNQTILIPAFDISLQLKPGRNRLHFTPDRTGAFNISCWMGMMTTTFEVVAPVKETNPIANHQTNVPKDSHRNGY